MRTIVDRKNPHLGGNLLEGDPGSWCTSSWKFIIDKYNIKSVLDVGSGIGHAAKWFNELGLKTIAIDGLEYNVKNSLYPAIIHDLTKNFFEVKDGVDFVNCIEVVEHIEETYLDNLMTTLTQGKYVLITHALPGQQGHHHVNCKPSTYWIREFETRGYELMVEDTKKIKHLAGTDNAVHITNSGLFFKKIN